jgi:hypothetical protein
MAEFPVPVAQNVSRVEDDVHDVTARSTYDKCWS